MATTVDASIPLNVKSPTLQDSMANMSSLLGVQQQKQALAQSQVKTQQDQNALEEQKALGALNPRDYVDPNTGIIDADRYMKDAMSATPRTGLGVQRATQVYQAQQAQTAVNTAGQNLNRDVRGDVASRFSALTTDPSATYNDYVRTADAIKKDNPQAGKLVDSYLAQLDPNGDIQNTHQKATTLNRAVLPPGENLDKPIILQTGAAQVPGTQAPRTGAVATSGQSIANQIPPGFEMTEDPVTHNKYLWNRQTGETRPFGTGAPTGGRGGSAGGPGASPSAPPQRQVGEADAQLKQVDTNWQNHQGNINAASAANQQRDQIHQVVKLLDTGMSTGAGAQGLANVEQRLAQIPGLEGLAGENSKAAKLDLLNKYLERIGAQFGSLSGSPAKTDAGAESLRAQVGSTGYTASALRDVMKYTDAQYSAAQAKSRAEQQFLSTKGNSILNQHEFESKWRDSYDPRVYQLGNESKETIKGELAKMKPEERATFLKKYAELKELGAAPQ
jgi:hypothetical protein